MKKVILVGLIILILGGLTACENFAQTVTVTVTSTDQMQSQINELTSQLEELQDTYDTLEEDCNTAQEEAQGQIAGLNGDLAALQGDYDTLQELYDNLVSGIGTELRNPTWAELRAFIAQDNTDLIRYNINTFACSGYATLIRDNAHDLGFRVAYIQIKFTTGSGHAFNAFQTSDLGFVYIDCTGNEKGTASDKVGYVQAGKLYQTLPLSVVLEEYISCDGDPEDFWQPLTYKTTNNPFAYAYYTEYQARRAFLSATINAYNNAVGQYNSHTGGWTVSQITTWNSNINALKAELGNLTYEPMGTVENIETYWGNN